MKSKCSKCGIKTELFCNNCYDKVRGKYRRFVPLVFWDKEKKVYRFGCNVTTCPCNDGSGMCGVTHISLPTHFLHEYDGDNIITQVCG